MNGPQDAIKAARSAAPFVELGERLRQIGGRSASAPEELLDPALAAILEATGATAGAICFYDPAHELLRLAVECGLSDEGCRRLRTVRRNDPNSWDMPLQGLLNRRVYLIDSAARNRYVPPLVEPATSVRTIACLPIFAGVTRLGSLVLVACTRSISEADVRGLEKPLRDLAATLEAVKRRTAAPKPAAAAATAARPAANDAAPAAPAVQPDRANAEVETLVASLAAAERERARLAAALETAAAERAAMARAAASAPEGGTQRADEVARLVARLAEVEGAAARERERVAEWEREREQLAADLAAAAERERRMREELDAVSARTGEGREKEVEEALARAGAAEEAREAASRDAEAARAALARAEDVARTLEDEKAKASAECERLLGAVQAMLAERERLEKGLAEARAREAEARARVADLERQVEAVGGGETDAGAGGGAELDRLKRRLADAEATATRERDRVGAWEREREQLAGELRDAAARERQVREDLAALMESAGGTPPAESLRNALHRVRAAEDAKAAADADARAARDALATAESAVKALEGEKDRARAEIARLETAAQAMLAERERLERALAETREREGEARGRLGELERGVEALRAEREAEATALKARVAEVAAERDRLTAALDAVQAERDFFAADEAAADAAHARLEEALVREVAAARNGQPVAEEGAPPPEPPVVEIHVEPGPPAAPARAPGARHTLVVLDDEAAAWTAAARSAEQLLVMSAKDGASRLAELAPASVLVNLAAAGAVECLRAVRAAGSTARFTGCIAAAGADRALSLGTVDALARPLEPDAVLGALQGMPLRGMRVLTAGGSAEALISLRQALAREGMSVSMAWDGKQATDLLAMARPAVVVVELALPARAGYRFVAQLATCDPIPHAIVVPGDDDPAQGFAAIVAQPVHGAAMQPLARVLARAAGDARA